MTLRTFVSKTRSNSDKFASPTLSSIANPALFTSTSNFPNCSIVSLTIRSATFVTSATIGSGTEGPDCLISIASGVRPSSRQRLY